MDLKVEYIDINELITYANNAKIHTAEQVEQIKKSIQEFGMNDPIAIWKNNEIIEGHGRLLALKELGYETVPVIRLDSLTDEQRKAYALVHNKLTMNTGFDIDLLSMELEDINDIDMDYFGFSIDENVDLPKEIIKPELEFTEVLGEEHNYIVLYFDNEVDWLQLQSILDVETKKNLSTRRDGYLAENMQRKCKGRVFKGAEALERMREHFENIN